MSTARTAPTARLDGRNSRWTEHRKERRQQLTEAALRAIREHGASVGMDEISAVAGTSKTVIYRHLGDRLGLFRAVCETVDARILKDFRRALSAGGIDQEKDALGADPRPVVVAVLDSYLGLVEKDPEVYRFVTRRPLVDVPVEEDPLAGLSDTIADALAGLLGATLEAYGRDTSAADPWAHGLVGFVRESADRWLATPDRAPRAVMVEQLADLAAYGLSGVLSGRPITSEETPR